MIEEVEIVHGHDLTGAAGGHEERVQRVGDVLGPREALDGRPPEPMPGQVEDPDWDARVDDPAARNPIRRQAVRPRARKEREDVGRDELTGEGGGDFVDILANPGALAKRRPIVEQDAQVRAMVAQPIVATTPYTSIN